MLIIFVLLLLDDDLGSVDRVGYRLTDYGLDGVATVRVSVCSVVGLLCRTEMDM